MKSEIQLVKEFFDAMKLEYQIEPKQEVSMTLMLKRIDLIQEELNEYKQDVLNHAPLKNRAKELTDILYVVYGAILTEGLIDEMELAFAMVHQSNMSKLDNYGNPVYNEQGKVIKGANYKPANLGWLDGCK